MAQEELQIILKALGVRDTAAALKLIAERQRDLGREGEGAGAAAARGGEHAARGMRGWEALARTYDQAGAAQNKFRESVAGLVAELSGANIAERAQTISAALAQLSGGVAGLSAPSFSALAAELAKLQDAGAALTPELQQIVAAEQQMQAIGAEAAEAQQRLAAETDKVDAALAAERSRMAELVAELSGQKASAEVAEIARAVEQLGGGSRIAEPQLKALGARLHSLEAAGAKLPPQLASIANAQSAASAATEQLGARAQQLAARLGPAGAALSALGPAGLAAAAGVVAVAGGITFALQSLAEWTRQLAAAAGGLTDLSAETGIATDTLQEWAHIGGEVGVSQDAMAAAALRAARVIAEGGEQVQGAIQRIGLSLDDLRQMGPAQNFEAIMAGLRGIPDAAQRASVATQLFGRDTAILRLLSADFGALREEAHALGLVLGKETLAQFDDLGDQFATLDEATTALKMSLVQMVFGGADAAGAVRELAIAVGEAATLARDSAGAFADLYAAITGSSVREQVEELRFMISSLRTLRGLAKGEGFQFRMGVPPVPQRVENAPPPITPEMSEREKKLIADLRAEVAKLRAEHAGAFASMRADIEATYQARLRDAGGLKAAQGALAAWRAEALRAGEIKIAEGLLGPSPGAIAATVGDIARSIAVMGGSAALTAAQIEKAGAALAAAQTAGATLPPELERIAEGFRLAAEAAKAADEIARIAAEQERIFGLLAPTTRELTNAFLEITTAAERHGDVMGMSTPLLLEYKAQLDGMAEQAFVAGEKIDGLADELKRVNEELRNRGQFVNPFAGASADAEGIGEADAALAKWVEEMEKAQGMLGSLSDSLRAFGQSFLANFVDAISAGIGAAINFKTATSGIGKGLAVLEAGASAYASGSVLGGAASGAAFGASIGSVIPGVGTVLGGVLGGIGGGILGLFGGKAKRKKELAELRAELLSMFGGSMEELQKKARDLGVDISRAFTTDSPKELKRIIESLTGAMEAQQKRVEGVKVAFEGLGLRVQGFASEMEEVAEATERQQATFDRLGLFAVASFAAMVRETGDVIGALGEMGGSLDELIRLQETYGFTATNTLQKLLEMRGFVVANEDIAQSLQGLNLLMQGLGDAGLANAEIYNAFGQDAVELFNQMVERGQGANQAMALMQPTLQRLWEHQRKFGDITDEATLALLGEAEAQGLVGESMMSVNEQILQVLLAIGEAIGAQIPEDLRRMGDAGVREFGRLNQAAGSLKFPDIPGGGEVPAPNEPGAGFQHGGRVNAPLSGMPITVHGLEHIIPAEAFERIVGAAVQRGFEVGSLASARRGGGSVDQPILLTATMDGEPLFRGMTRAMERGRVRPRRGRWRWR